MDTKPLIIGISGKIGSGKDTAKDILLTEFPIFTATAFADNVRRVASVLTGIPVDIINTREGKATKLDWITPGLTVGILLQKIGVSMRDSIHPDIWVKSCLYGRTKPTIVTDVRFENEARYIIDNGGILIRLNGDPGKVRERNEDGRDLNHISETALDNFPFPIVYQNTGTKEQLAIFLTLLIKERLGAKVTK